MPGSKHRRRKKSSHSRSTTGTAGNVKGEVSPRLPSSGQILGVLVRTLGVTHPNLETWPETGFSRVVSYT